MVEKCYWWDDKTQTCTNVHMNGKMPNCGGVSVLCGYYEIDTFNNEKRVIKDSGERTEFATGAVRDNHGEKGRMDLMPWNAIIELSKHCQRGALHYGENNIRLGVPFHSLADSGARHLAKWMSGITDEPTHLVAACWNLMWLLEETLTRPELNDMYWNKDNK